MIWQVKVIEEGLEISVRRVYGELTRAAVHRLDYD